MADLVGSFIQGYYNDRQQARAFEQQKELQSDAQNYNTLMFNMANQYNSPAQQMARFRAAGLNENLIYGQMANTASSPTMSSSSAPSAASIGGASALETAQIGLLNAQRDNIKADTDLKESGVILNAATIEQMGHQNNWTDQQIRESVERVGQIRKSLDEMNANIDKLKADGRLADSQALLNTIDSFFRESKNQAEINKTLADTGLSNAQAKEILTLLLAKKANIVADTNLKIAEKNATHALKQLYRVQARKAGLDADLIERTIDDQVKLLEQAVSTGSIPASMAEDYPSLMRGLQLWQQILGPIGGIVSSLIIRGGMTKGASKIASGSAESPNFVDNWSYGGLTSTY